MSASTTTLPTIRTGFTGVTVEVGPQLKDAAALRLRVTRPAGRTGAGEVLLLERRVDLMQGARLRLQPNEDLDARAAMTTLEASLALITKTTTEAASLSQSLATTFRGYRRMLNAMFVSGIVCILLAAANSLLRDEASTNTTTTVSFLGLGGVTFVVVLLLRPAASMRRLAPETAWLLVLVNTYWTKLAYLNNTATAVHDLQEAQATFDTSMALFLTASNAVSPRDREESTVAAPSAGSSQDNTGKYDTSRNDTSTGGTTGATGPTNGQPRTEPTGRAMADGHASTTAEDAEARSPQKQET